MNHIDKHLRSLLATGPTDSRDAIASMAAAGYTPKQIRAARERLGVLIERKGNGVAMRSAWRLRADPPKDETPSAAQHSLVVAVHVASFEADSAAQTVSASPEATPTTAAAAAPSPSMPSAASPPAPAAAPRRVDPLERSRDIRSMPYDELKVYAAQIGVPRRDIEHLTEDRLRQNCALTVHALLDAITE